MAIAAKTIKRTLKVKIVEMPVAKQMIMDRIPSLLQSMLDSFQMKYSVHSMEAPAMDAP